MNFIKNPLFFQNFLNSWFLATLFIVNYLLYNESSVIQKKDVRNDNLKYVAR